MKTIFAAVALSIAIPGVAFAQAAPTKVEPKKNCCPADKSAKDCCKDMKSGASHAGHDMAGHDMAGHDGHAGHDMKPAPKPAQR